MGKEREEAMDESGSRLFSMVADSGMPEDDVRKTQRLVDMLGAACGDYGEFLSALHGLLDRSVEHPLLLSQVLETASLVAAVYSDDWEPISRGRSPFCGSSRSVPVVGIVGDDGTVWDERYKEKILANARPVFPGTTDARNPDVR